MYEFRTSTPLFVRFEALLHSASFPSEEDFPEQTSDNLQTYRELLANTDVIILPKSLKFELLFTEDSPKTDTTTATVMVQGIPGSIVVSSIEQGGGGDCFYYALLGAIHQVTGVDVTSSIPRSDDMVTFRKLLLEYAASNYLHMQYLENAKPNKSTPTQLVDIFETNTLAAIDMITVCQSINTIHDWAQTNVVALAAEALRIEVVIIKGEADRLGEVDRMRPRMSEPLNTVFIFQKNQQHFQLIDRSPFRSLSVRPAGM